MCKTHTKWGQAEIDFLVFNRGKIPKKTLLSQLSKLSGRHISEYAYRGLLNYIKEQELELCTSASDLLEHIE